MISFYGCLYGLKNKKINYVVRIRTDTLINLKIIYDFIINQNESKTIYIPKIKQKGPYFTDLYFAGSKKIIDKFLNASVAKDKEDSTLFK